VKESEGISFISSGFAYNDALNDLVIATALNSAIVVAQSESSNNIITMQPMTEAEIEGFIGILGGDPLPVAIMIYPTSFDGKDEVVAHLEAWNTRKPQSENILYTDLASMVTSLTSGIMSAITMVLLAFASISLVVSLIMIAIITYTSVLERTKEIGVLRALGARKKDITRVFNAETGLIGVFSGVLGVSIAWGLTFPTNVIIENATDLSNVAVLPFYYAVGLIILSTILTICGGLIPAKMAAKKDAVVALRAE
jgi:putative ABC transport system permease protein